MKPGSKKWKLLMAKVYGIGAGVVIIGALFKIQHWPFASLLLIIGLLTEAIIFFLSAFEPPHEEPDWSLVYPELATGEQREGGDHSVGGSLTEQLDGMLAEAKIEPELIASLGDGMRSLSTQAGQLSDMSDAAVATQEYSNSLRGASDKVNELASTYQEASESLTGLKEGQSYGAAAGEHLQKMSENLSSLNNMYELQLQELEKSRQLYSGMAELVENLSDSIEDTRKYKDNISDLAKNLESLNTVYSNMLNAMGGGNKA
ncbi:gliding motility protein GldL [Sanyastnella coralliicola]|uniref:type IX secretion system motor protein PorL/GldL n=1 Tax=Sanyastnella coralliicola TaxID=3069118 RepID=UPI0027BB0D56|nr:gliding motility protein GldL [Longitalea sp. SCSIO 12813]